MTINKPLLFVLLWLHFVAIPVIACGIIAGAVYDHLITCGILILLGCFLCWIPVIVDKNNN